jgi:hypothetical protein
MHLGPPLDANERRMIAPACSAQPAAAPRDEDRSALPGPFAARIRRGVRRHALSAAIRKSWLERA